MAVQPVPSQQAPSIAPIAVVAAAPVPTANDAPAVITAAALPDPQLKAAQDWTKVHDHMHKWFYAPDIQALEIVLTALCAHYYPDTDPLWLFVIGPSGGGKTSQTIVPLLRLENTHLMGDLTPRTLLSSYAKAKYPSLLHQIGSGIMLFKDFTTFLSKRHEDRSAIASQLREVYDGEYVKHSGVSDPVKWKGKITIVAAATPVLERHWALHRELGERFMQVRWARKDGIQMSKKARAQIGHEARIASTSQNFVKAFFQGPPPITFPPPTLTSAQSDQVSAMAELLSCLRGSIVRDSGGNRDIIDVPQIEDASRPGKCLAAIAQFHAALFRKQAVDADDLACAKRVAFDSVPNIRSLIVQSLPKTGERLGAFDVMQYGNINASTLKWNAAELEALGMVEVIRSEGGMETLYQLTPKAVELWRDAFPAG